MSHSILSNLKMVAAGSGSRILETAPEVLKEALDMSGAEKPVVLTIGTAEPSHEWHSEFVEATNRQFGHVLGAKVIQLHEFRKAPSATEISDKIAEADTIWVAGGDTLYMIDFWQAHGIDIALKEAAERGVVMSGGSAGMLAWMEQGHSDSHSYRVSERDPWDYIFVKGLGQIAATGCPHYDSMTKTGELRGTDFQRRLLADDTLPPIGIGIANMAALAINNGHFRVISLPDTEYPDAQVHIFTKTEQGLSEKQLAIATNYEKLDL